MTAEWIGAAALTASLALAPASAAAAPSPVAGGVYDNTLLLAVDPARGA